MLRGNPAPKLSLRQGVLEYSALLRGANQPVIETLIRVAELVRITAKLMQNGGLKVADTDFNVCCELDGKVP